MKRIIVFLVAVAIVAGTAVEAGARAKKARSGELIGLVKNYKHEDGFEVVSVGSLGMGLMKMIARASAETEEDKAAIDVIKDIGKVVVVEYSDADSGRRDSFNSRIAKVLDGAEKIVEVKDDGETVNIYGTSADDGESIDDIVIFIPEDCTLVCLFGTISSKNIADLVTVSNNAY